MSRKKAARIVLTPEELRKLQLVELEILLELDRVCRQNKIEYFLCGGTLLGAVRHKGFIPWDDDVDVGFLRGDYERFCEIFAKESDSGKFFLQTWRTDPHYRWNYGKIRRLGTEYIRLGQEHMQYVTGISIDIFPYDYLPVDARLDREIERHTFINEKVQSTNQLEMEKSFVRSRGMKNMRRQAFICKICRKAAWSVCGQYQEAKRLTRVLYKLAARVPGRFWAALMDKTARKYNDKALYGGARVRQFGHLPSSEKEPRCGFASEMLESYTDITFEGHNLRTICEARAYLSLIYGKDYMRLPPPEARTGVAPVSKIDFGNGYEKDNGS